MRYTGTYHQCFHNLLSTLLRVGRCARQSANLCAHPISADCYLVQFIHKLFYRLPQISWLPISIYHCILQPALPYLCLPRFISKAKSALQSGKFFRMQFKSHISKCKGCTLLKSRRRLRLECYCGPHAFLPSELKLTHTKNEKT